MAAFAAALVVVVSAVLSPAAALAESPPSALGAWTPGVPRAPGAVRRLPPPPPPPPGERHSLALQAARVTPPGAQPAVLGQAADEAATVASQAAQRAWGAVAEVKKAAEANKEFLPLLKAEIATARAAADVAKREDEAAAKFLEEARVSTHDAALKAAQDYLKQVQDAAAAATASAGDRQRLAARSAEAAVGVAAARAAGPYHRALLRGQKDAVDCAQRAQALAAASNNLRVEGAELANAAVRYQQTGQTVQAKQAMMTAHELATRSARMREQAEELHRTAQEIADTLPLYHQAEEAAAVSAAVMANPPALPRLQPAPY